MASYSAVIDLRVQGQEGLRTVSDRIETINRLVKQIKPVPTLFDARAGAEITDAKNKLSALLKAYADGDTTVAKYSRSLAGLNQQMSTFRSIANNAKVGSDEFNNSLKAGEIASRKLLDAELDRLAALRNIYTRQATGGLTATDQGPSKMVKDLLSLDKKFPGSIAGLNAFQRELLEVQQLVSMNSVDFRELEQAIYKVDVALGKVQFGPAAPPMQGPELPANFIPPGRAATGARGGPPPGSLAFNPNAAAENLALGAGFPLLFGGGVGQVAGGLLGSFFGSGFGGQILGSAIGQQLEDALRRISEIGTATKTLNLDALRDSVIAVNSDLDVTVERLIKAGQANAAQAEIARQVTLQTGLLPEQTAATSQAVNGLGTAWNEVVGAVSGLLSIIGTPFVTALAVIAQGIAKVVQGINYSLQLVIRIAPPLALLGKLFTAIGNALPAINEEQNKIRAEIEKQSDSYSTQIGLALKLEDIDKRRNKGNSVAAKINNNELDRQDKQLQLNAKVEKEIQDVRLKYKGQNTKLLEDQIKGLAEIEKREINRAAARQRERLELEKINEQYGSILKDLERTAAFGEQRTLLAQLAGALTEEEARILNTLNEQSLVIDTILAKRRQLAELEQGDAGTQQLSALVNEITALENKTIQLNIQVKKEALEKIRLDLENATAAANRQLDIQVNTIQGQNTLYQLQLQLLQAQNSLSLQRIDQEEAFLLKTIETTDNVKTQEEAYRALFDVATARYKISLSNIKIERAAVLAEIESRLQLLDIEVRRQQIKYEELRVLAIEAKARGILNRSHLEALQLQGGVVELQKRSYNFAVENAGIQRKIADTVYRQKVEAAGFAYNQEVAALRTERLASGMERAASASMSMQNSLAANTLTKKIYGSTTTTRTLPTGTPIPGSKVLPFAKGGIVTKPTLGLIGEGGENEFIIPQSKAAGFAANYLSGARGSSAIPSAGGGDTIPTINITTGPVMQQNGQNYVSIPDMERALATLADTMLLNNRTPGGRRYQGVN